MTTLSIKCARRIPRTHIWVLSVSPGNTGDVIRVLMARALAALPSPYLLNTWRVA